MSTYFEAVTNPVIAADFDYFRLPREKWALLLLRLRQMGINALSLSLPWGFHQNEPGAVDLTGAANPRRDILHLLGQVAALDFVCLLNPGPYTPQVGVLGDGLPIWLLKQATDLEAAIPPAVTDWFSALSQALTGQQWPDGPLIALYLNPQSGRPQPPGAQVTKVKWPIWLRKRYENVEALNAAYTSNYRTVNEVEFPENWDAATPVAKDAQTFLEAVQQDTQADYRQILLDQGWHIPIYSPALAAGPARQDFTLTRADDLTALNQAQLTGIVHLHQPIQVDPDAADIGRGPVWGQNAPIRFDSSVRLSFWQVRQKIWQQLQPETQVAAQTLVVSFTGGSAISRSGSAPLKLELPIETKAGVYRLTFSGKLTSEESLKVSRGKLSGLYEAETFAGQTDLIWVLAEPTAPLTKFPLNYLGRLLASQAQTLNHTAHLASALGQSLAAAQTEPRQAATPSSRPPADVLARARQGLSEADVALRKAIASIEKLESGFATILSQKAPQPATPPPTVPPAIFEGEASEVLVEVGAVCAKIGPVLQTTAETLQRNLAVSPGFTVEQYQQHYQAAVAAARAAREPLLDLVALLRMEIAAERLPLLAWRVHDQLQELAESLRWGVVRGEGA